MSTIVAEKRGRVATLVKTRIFRVTSLASGALLLLTIALPIFRLFPELYGKPVIPLHYNIHYGVDWTGVWWQIFLLPAMGAVFMLVNLGIAAFFVRRDSMLLNTALVSNVIITAFLFTAMMFIVSLNVVYG